MKVRPVNPMSLMTDVFVELERLKLSLEQLRDRVTENDRKSYSELYEATRHCREIIAELKTIASLLRGAEHRDYEKLPDEAPPPPSKPTLVKK